MAISYNDDINKLHETFYMTLLWSEYFTINSLMADVGDNTYVNFGYPFCMSKDNKFYADRESARSHDGPVCRIMKVSDCPHQRLKNARVVGANGQVGVVKDVTIVPTCHTDSAVSTPTNEVMLELQWSDHTVDSLKVMAKILQCNWTEIDIDTCENGGRSSFSIPQEFASAIHVLGFCPNG